MSGNTAQRDLMVLVADTEMAQTIKGLLDRPASLATAHVDVNVERHPGRDSGCRIGAVDFLRPFLGRYRYALVVFDLHGSGSTSTREATQREVDANLARNGWENRGKAIVIEPELEAWVWGRSPRVADVLGWTAGYADLRRWLHSEGLWPDGEAKPPDPRTAMKKTMAKTRLRKSPRVFFDLANAVSLDKCRDPSFGDLRATLHSWFPPPPSP